MRCEKLFYTFDVLNQRYLAVRATPGDWGLIDLALPLCQQTLRRGQPEREIQSYRFGNIAVNFGRGELLRDGRPVELTPIEFKLLSLFVHARGHVLSREQLLNGAWGPARSPRTVSLITTSRI